MNNIRYARLEDVDEIKKIIDEGISQDYYSADEIITYIQDSDKFLLVATSEEDKALAAMFCMIGKLKDMCILENIPYPNSAFEGYNEESVTVVYKTASTYKNVRQKGYVSKLFAEYNNIFNNIEHDLRLGLALVLKDGTVPIKSHVDKYDFIPKKMVLHPWSNIKSYCTYCDNEYCRCNGMIYIKENRFEG